MHALNHRFQAMLTFYIEKASFINVEPHWYYFLLYRAHQENPKARKEYSLIGYSTCYEPPNPGKQTYNSRVSQFLILPNFQRMGYGSKLLEMIYAHYLADPRCVEMTVEDPSDDFHVMKDLIDTKLIARNGFFQVINMLLN